MICSCFVFYYKERLVVLASTFGIKTFLSTDTNFTKTAIMTKLKQLSFHLENEKPQRLPLRASVTPELLLLTSCPLGVLQIGFPQAVSTQLPPDPIGWGCWINAIPSRILLATT